MSHSNNRKQPTRSASDFAKFQTPISASRTPVADVRDSSEEATRLMKTDRSAVEITPSWHADTLSPNESNGFTHLHSA